MELRLDVVTPNGLKLSEEVDSVVVRTPEGEMGFLKNHAPLVAALVPQALRYTKAGETHKLFVSGGFVEVADNVCSVVTPVAEETTEIDFKRAQEARERALRRLNSSEQIDEVRARLALARANARLSLQ